MCAAEAKRGLNRGELIQPAAVDMTEGTIALSLKAQEKGSGHLRPLPHVVNCMSDGIVSDSRYLTYDGSVGQLNWQSAPIVNAAMMANTNSGRAILTSFLYTQPSF